MGAIIVFDTGMNIDEASEMLTEKCRDDDSAECPANAFTCPFGSKDCDEVKKEDWKEVLEFYKVNIATYERSNSEN